MKNIFVLFAGAVTGITMYGQSLSPQVMASSGSSFVTASSRMEYTIGEPLTLSLTSGSYTVTQGFHQPEIHYNSVEENTDFQFTVFPNPTEDVLNINSNIELKESFHIILTNNLGEIIFNRMENSNNTRLDVSTLAAGNYHLQIIYNHNQTNSFTIIKTSLNK